MKIKGIIKKLKNLKSINNKNMSWNFSGAVVGSVGSVQFQIVPCPRSYLFSMSVGPLQCLGSDNYRALICHCCHFQSGSRFFILASSVCRSLQCLISALRGGGEGGHLFRLTCSVVLWGGRGPAHKRRWRVWGALAVYVRTTRGLPQLAVCASGSTLLRLQGALQGRHPKWGQRLLPFPGLSAQVPGSAQGTDPAGRVFMPFPGLSAQIPGSPQGTDVFMPFPGLSAQVPGSARVFMPFPGLSAQIPGSAQGTDPAGRVSCPSRVQAAEVTTCLPSALSQVGRESDSPPGPRCSVSGCAVRAQSQVSPVSPLGS